MNKLLSIFPKKWEYPLKNCDFLYFRNLQHFIFEISKLTQKKDNKCGISYSNALKNIQDRVPTITPSEQEDIRDKVRQNLHRRGLITGDIYERYKYVENGTVLDVDVGKFVNGEPDCILSPAKDYIDFFYELYVSISYPYSVEDSVITANIAKLLAAVEELERQHIFIKITLILPITDIRKDKEVTFFSSIPLFSHKERKTVSTMSAVITPYLLRKFYFAILENKYQDNLSDNYGYVIDLPECVSLYEEFDEVAFFNLIFNAVGA